MSSPSGAPSYSAVLRQPYALRTLAAAVVGRFSYGIVFLSLVVALSQTAGSYAWAGTAVACFGLSSSFLAPLRARLLDRQGPRRVLPAMATVYAALLAALTVATWASGTPPWALMILTLAAGACSPPLGPVMRALWSDLMPDQELRQRAFSLDTVVEELLYVFGPLVAGLFIAFGNPACGVGLSAVLVLTGTLAMVTSPFLRDQPAVAAQIRDESDSQAPTGAGSAAGDARTVQDPSEEASPHGGRLRGLVELLAPVVVAGGVGMSLGALELLVVAFAQRHHHVAAVAWIQATLSIGSAIGGMAYGARTWHLSSRQRLPLLAFALSVMLATAGFTSNFYLLTVVVGCAGVFVAPALSTAYLVADEYATAKTRIQAGTWVNSAFNAGNSGGTTAAGLLLGQIPLGLCFVAAAVPTLASTASALVRPRQLVRSDAPAMPTPVPADTQATEQN
jgi:MFS family permease